VIVRALGVAALALFFLGAFTPLATHLYATLAMPTRIGPAEAIVVMAGGGVLGDGQLSDTSRRRTALGIELYRDGRAPLLVLSGAIGPGAESAARAAVARTCGVADAAMLAVAAGHTTHEEVDTLGALLRARGVRRILLVTDGSHMRRAARLFEAARFEVLPVPFRALDDPTQPGERILLFHETLREGLALLYYELAGYL
jgi:uncharacterized SAM-binding protein YcdF (DUF218 family)